MCSIKYVFTAITALGFILSRMLRCDSCGISTVEKMNNFVASPWSPVQFLSTSIKVKWSLHLTFWYFAVC